MRFTWLCSSLLLLTLWPFRSHAQQFDIGQMHYRLRMTMNQVQAATHDPIYLDDLGNGSQTATWVVREKQGEQNLVLIGSIAFTNGRVERLERDLRSFSTEEAKSVGDALFRAVDQLKRDDPDAKVSAVSTFLSSASGEVKKITIGAGSRRVEISIPDGKTGEMVVTEVLCGHTLLCGHT